MTRDIKFIDSSGAKPGTTRVVINNSEEFIDALQRAESLVKGESPRAKVLIYVSSIELALHEVLRSTLVPSNQKEDTLLSEKLGSFESQIDLAFRVGAISQHLWRDLHIIRELRDDCNSRIENFSFEHTAIKSSVSTLERNVGRQAFAGLPVLRMDTEDKFSYIARSFLITLQNQKESGERLNEATREKLYRD